MPLSVLPSTSDERNAQITIGPTKKQRYYTHRDASGSEFEGTPPMQTMESVDARDRRTQNMQRDMRSQVAGSTLEKDSEGMSGQLIPDISEDSAKSTRQFKTLHYLITRKTKASKVKYRRRSKPKTPKPAQAKAATGASTRKPGQSTARDYPPKGASTVDGHVLGHSSQIHAQVHPTTSERLVGNEGSEQDDDPNSLYSATLKVLRKHPKWNVETMTELRKAVVATVWPEPERPKSEEHAQLDLADYDIENSQMQGISYSRPAPPTSLPHHEPVPKKPPLPPYVLGRTQGPPLYVPPPDAQPIPPQTYSYVGPTFSRMPHPQSRTQPAPSRVTSNVSNASTDRSSMYSDHTTRTYPVLSRRNPPPPGSNSGAAYLQHAEYAAKSSQQQAIQNPSTLFPTAMQPPRPTHTYTLPPSFQAPPLPQFHPSLQPADQPHLMKPPPPLRPTQQVVAYSTTLLPPPIPPHPVSHPYRHSTDHIPSLPPIEESPPRKNIVARSEPVAKAAEKPQPTQSIKRLDAIKLGGLGPDTSNEEYIAKLDKYHKQKQYAQQVRMLARSLLHKQQNSTRPSSRGSMTSQNPFATVSSKPRSHTARAATNPLSVKYAPKDVEAAAMKRRKMQSYAASIPKPAQSAPTRNQLRRQSTSPDSDDDEYFERRKAESELRKLEEEHQKGVVAVESIRREMGL